MATPGRLLEEGADGTSDLGNYSSRLDIWQDNCFLHAANAGMHSLSALCHYCNLDLHVWSNRSNYSKLETNLGSREGISFKSNNSEELVMISAAYPQRCQTSISGTQVVDHIHNTTLSSSLSTKSESAVEIFRETVMSCPE